MIDANKDEARKCIRLAKSKINAGDKASAKRFILKAKRLDPSISIEDLDELVRSRSPSRDRGNQVNKEETPQPSTEKAKSDAAFSKSQVDAVRRVLACKDYYELLGVSKTASEEEIKKCYRALALKFHPDKNHAPGATEAFKKIGTAFNVLTDNDRRRRYDQFGSEEEIQRIPQAHRHGDTFFQYDADVFNMFFNGFPFSQVYRDHRQRPHRSRESERESNYFVYVQLVPLIILFVLSFFSNFFIKDPYYNLSRSNKYYVERYTEAHKVLYYVKPTFEKDFTGNIETLESQIEEEHIGNMRFRCFREKDYKENLLFRARYYGDQAAHDKAMHMSMPNCERLVEMFGG